MPARDAPTTMRSKPTVRRAWNLAASLALIALVLVTSLFLDLPWGTVADLLVGLGLGLLLLFLGSGVLALLRWLTSTVPAAIGDGVIVATVGALVFLVVFNDFAPLAAVAVWAIWLVAIAAPVLGIAFAVAPDRATARTRPTWARVGAPLLGVAVFAAAALWWWHPGDAGPPATPVAVTAAQPALPDPGAAGALTVASFTYGSGVPRWRPEYGPAADRTTTPVDVRDRVPLSGFAAAARRTALGHGMDAVPRNAVVWHPAEGAGPYPLVLVAHGNANLFTPSELGYEWLGRHLASHGYVVASIDASAFNSLPILTGELRDENDARALLFLAHLQLWHAWQEGGDGIAATVDLDRVVLIGHSRGGEAAAIAAAFDGLGRIPADATTALADRVGGPYGIRTVVAFAPSDGQYRVGDRGTVLEDVDYLVLQGGYDADVTSFQGERQYERTEPAEGGFKAAVYLHEANHGQFNTRWGRHDLAPPSDQLLRTGAIMPGGDQRRSAAALITAFLEATVRDQIGYLDVFRRPEVAAAWLSPVTTVMRYDDGAGIAIADFDEDVDPTTASLPGSAAGGEGLVVWREGDPRFRGRDARQVNAVTLGWRVAGTDTAPAYRLRWDDQIDLGAHDGSTLRLEVARGTTAFPDGTPAPTAPLDAHVVLGDAAGRRAAVPLSFGQGVPPDLPARLSRAPLFALPRFAPLRYPVFATVDLPIEAFLEVESDLDLAELVALDLEFDLVPEGMLVVRSIALVNERAP
jgi:hypothetical protein